MYEYLANQERSMEHIKSTTLKQEKMYREQPMDTEGPPPPPPPTTTTTTAIATASAGGGTNASSWSSMERSIVRGDISSLHVVPLCIAIRNWRSRTPRAATQVYPPADTYTNTPAHHAPTHHTPSHTHPHTHTTQTTPPQPDQPTHFHTTRPPTHLWGLWGGPGSARMLMLIFSRLQLHVRCPILLAA